MEAGTQLDPLDAERADAATARGGALRGGGWIAGAATSLVSIPLLVRHLGVPDFGRYIAVLAAINIAALASDLGLTGLALREWSAADAEERPRIMRTLLGLRMVVAGMASVMAVGFALVADWSSAMVAGTAIGVVGLLAQVYGDFALVSLSAQLRFGQVAAVELLRSVLGTLAIVVLVVAGAGLVPFFAGYAIAAVAAALVALRLAGEAVPRLPRASRAELRPLLGDTLAYAAAAAAYVVYFRVVMLVVSIQAGAHDAGLFAIGYRVIEFSAAVAGVLAGTATPLLSRAHAQADTASFVQRARRTLLTTALAGMFSAIALAALAGLLADLIGGDQGEGAAAILGILAPTVFTTFVAFGMGAVLLVLRQYRQLLALNVISLAIALAAALALVPAEGARGGAVAVVIAEVFMAATEGVIVLGALRSLGYHRGDER